MVSTIVDLITSTFSGILEGLGSGVVALFSDLLYEADGTTLTAFAQFAFVIVGIGLAVGIFYTIMRVLKR